MESNRNLELVRFFGNNFMAQQLYLLSNQATLALGAIKHKPAGKVMQIQSGIWLCYVSDDFRVSCECKSGEDFCPH